MFFQQAAPKISFEEAKLRREEVKANFRTFIKICAAMMAAPYILRTVQDHLSYSY
ncbi:hypothetical protein H8356DRAFT_1745533 [Neocallimastix lanati (nom. inval.)]|uniref:Uncharacterized protein n=1 Tax=Neocallimastix californiae TaxID=1754190 RepID=A0A1Y2CEG2_9FUNG|nr:hypothetical protein H8356DRAFT_1745533 [Neocallimastix sp. JGI-2020a]ORY45402.1 hypothetical protein LY90DRAFT_703564 [Neocallimastix californiae]|eukprot:ORY45402.1 hypothetical protein LY90DRAFT_703564 [Neocallimastix californiae]